jgi:ubiquinone/menaquinone biosynthesis C-methylase UbiE
MAAANAPNQQIYNASEVALHYANLAYLTACERLLFQTFIQPGMAILDIGVGGGRTTPYLSGLASSYVGIDYAEEMILACRRKFPSLFFQVANAADLSCFADASFDVIVLAFNSMDYVLPEAQRQRCLEECRRVLKTSGMLIFSSHNPRSILKKPAWNSERVARLAKRISGVSDLLNACTRIPLAVAVSMYAVVRCLGQSAMNIGQKIGTLAFWKGHGLWLDRSHGGLITHTWTPKYCIREVSAAGFRITKYLGDDFPGTSGQLVTDWYYYVFSKI